MTDEEDTNDTEEETEESIFEEMARRMMPGDVTNTYMTFGADIDGTQIKTESEVGLRNLNDLEDEDYTIHRVTWLSEPSGSLKNSADLDEVDDDASIHSVTVEFESLEMSDFFEATHPDN